MAPALHLSPAQRQAAGEHLRPVRRFGGREVARIEQALFVGPERRGEIIEFHAALALASLQQLAENALGRQPLANAVFHETPQELVPQLRALQESAQQLSLRRASRLVLG